jgi:hypothetical protein
VQRLSARFPFLYRASLNKWWFDELYDLLFIRIGGRIAAFKGVRDDYKDVHSGTLDYSIGRVVSMPRELCNPDPDQTCTAGLHLGALDYIKENGYGWGPNRRMLLCAFWPRHVVAVPVDYQGGKIRVEQLEVLDDVDRDYVDEVLGRNQTVVRGYTPEPDPAWKLAVVGDKVVHESSDLDRRVAEVVAIDPDEDSDTRLKLKDAYDQKAWVANDDIDRIVTNEPAFMAEIDDEVRIEGADDVPDGWYRVVDIDDGAIGPDEARLQIDYQDEWDADIWVSNSTVKEIRRASQDPNQDQLPLEPALAAKVGDKVRVEAHSLVPGGVYQVAAVDDETFSGLRLEVNVPGQGDVWVHNRHVKEILS